MSTIASSDLPVRTAAMEQASHHVHLVLPGHDPQNPPGSVQNLVGQGHPAPPLLGAAQRDIGVIDFEHRIAGYKRGCMPIGTETQVYQVEHPIETASYFQLLVISEQR